MKKRDPDKIVVTSMRMRREIRHLVEQLVAKLTQKRQRLHRMTEVIEEAIRRMAQAEGVT